jgi:hypothetical protein
MALVVRIVLASILAAAAAAKALRPGSAAAALGTFGVPLRIRLPAALALTAAELAIAVAVAVGVDAAAYCAAVLLVAFAAALVLALGTGGAGKLCACFGPRSRVSRRAVVRDLALAAGFAAVPSVPTGLPSAQQVLVAGLALAFVCIVVLAVAVLALVREVGVLRLRLGGEPALEVATEGPPIGSHVALLERFDPGSARFALAIFSSENCRLCDSLGPAIAAFRLDPVVSVEVFDEVLDADVWRALGIPGSPFAIALDREGSVRAKGTFNSYGQLESILAAAEQRVEAALA